MKHLGDITKLSGYVVPPVDIITGGSPCQDLSVAGKRAGLAGERSGLFMEQIRIIKEMREKDARDGRTNEHIRPRFMVWENVPGAFSSNGGEDFRAVLEETAKIVCEDAVIPRPAKGKWTPSGCIVGDGWSLAWRVHDAQYWGVPQRRKRICLLADFNGQDAGRILFELRRNTDEIFTKQTIMDFGIKSRYEIQPVSKGLSGNIEESGKAGKDAAEDIGSGIEETSGAISFQERAGKPGGGKGILIQNEHVGALSTLNNQSVCCLNDQGGSVMGVSKNVTGALRAQEHGHQPIVYGISAYESNAMKSSNPNSGIYEAETSRTLDLNGGSPACNQGGMAVVCLEGNGSRPSHQGDGWHEGDPMYTLNSTEHHAVAIENHPADSRVKVSEDGIVQTLSSRMGTGGGNVPAETLVASDYKDPPTVTYQEHTGTVDACIGKGTSNQLANNDMFVANTSVVRRLTPLECERLQGYPVVRKVKFTEMTKDEYIAWNINEGNIVVDIEHGKIYATRKPGGIRSDEPIELQGSVVNGYKVVSIRNGETKMQCRAHRVIWIAAHGIIPDGYVVDHINNDKQDNRISNLQILTAAENSTKARNDGLYKIREDAGTAKLSNEMHDMIQYVYKNTDLTYRQLSEIFGISKSRVGQIIHDEPWTDIGDWVDSKGKKHKGDADAPRYKALGNSIALPFWEWMAERMLKVLNEDKPTMASLFDGIGGFPLVYSRHGCEPVWASEIEEFPIAVTKRRFRDDNADRE